MVTLVVEDGTRVTGANTYISRDDAISYASIRGTTLADDSTTDDLLIQAMDYLEQQPFKGLKTRHDQAVQWPRSGVYIDSYLVDTDEIPTLLTEVQVEIAIAIDAGNGPLANLDRVQRRVKVGDLEVEYAPGQSETIVRAMFNKLRKLITSGFGSSNIPVNRS